MLFMYDWATFYVNVPVYLCICFFYHLIPESHLIHENK